MAGKKFPAIISMLFVQNLFMRLLPDGGRIVGQLVKVEQAPLFSESGLSRFRPTKGRCSQACSGGYSAWKRPAFSGSWLASVQ